MELFPPPFHNLKYNITFCVAIYLYCGVILTKNGAMTTTLDFLKIIKIIEENRLSFFTSSQLAEIVMVETKSLQNYLETLANNELIIRVEKGKYCRTYLKDRWVIGSNLINGGIVSHKSALLYHGLIQDSSSEVCVSSDHQKNNKLFRGFFYRFIKIRPHKYFGYDETENYDGKFRVTDPEKTILDCFDLPQYSIAFNEFVQLLGGVELREDKLIEYGIRLQNLSVLKRLAYLTEQLYLPGYHKFKKAVGNLINDKYTLLNPSGPDIGSFHAKWRIRDNMIQSTP